MGMSTVPRCRRRWRAWRSHLWMTPPSRSLPSQEANADGDLALLTLPFPGEPNSRAATAKMSTLREEHIPAAFDGVPAKVYVGGVTAEAADFFGIVDVYTPIVFAFVLGLSFIILMLVFRSIVIPVKAIIMNLLSVGATYGLLVLVFQKGVGTCWGSNTLRSSTHGYLCSCSPSSSVCPWTTTYSCSAASANTTTRPGTTLRRWPMACQSTGGMITGAALIMVAVFGGFAAGETIINQQVGFGLAVAVFLDATLVRSVLVPASMDAGQRTGTCHPG